MKPEVVVVGAGIAGLCAARMLHDAGKEVLVVARELGEASRVPDALLNPVRGKRGAVAPEAEEALGALWDFYPRFVPVHRGVLRPVPEADREAWKARLEGRRIPHRWLPEGLYLENAGWLQTAPLLQRLAEGLDILWAEVVRLEGASVYLASGGRVSARRLVFAGGASGAHLVGLGGRFTPGSVLQTQEHFQQARSYGVYVAGRSLGGSYLPHQNTCSPHQTQPHEAEWLLSGAERLLGYRPAYTSSWAGVRYRLDGCYLREIPGGYALTGFGSAAYFYAPLYAGRLLRLVG
ncbi:MAG: FAD-dependent oxidoreductase [Deinococcus-Thermus bacterium]|uniref:NAD(P)/FAD-dependent oxidoreductase n=1 Tax=Meiothermus luteus TaxID=2026184 RepID=UPI000E659E4B|nr:FAD-dependent oxidoreductase [Meiothermus luteus]RMH55536.1 MAG: FAD-dependent oxidoreductase [Deinococcota bacterium]